MTTPNVTSSTDSQMHNNIMTAGSKDRPPMLALGRYPQWSSRFLRYVDTRPNGEALRKCILSGPYKPKTVLVQVVEATDDSPAVLEHTTVKTPMNMSPENKAHFLAEKEAINLILTRIGDDIYSTVDACQTVNVQFLQQLQPEWSRFVTIVKQQHKLDEVLYHKLFDILKQYQNEVNELRAEKLARNANPLALVATTQASQDPYYQTSRTSSNSKNKNVDTTPWNKNDDHFGQFRNQRIVNVAAVKENVGSKVVQQSGIQCFNYKEYGHFAKECRKPKRVKDFAYHKEKMLLCKQAEQGVPLQAEQYDWLADTGEEVDEQELEAHYCYMAKIQEVPIADSGTDSEPVEQIQKKLKKANTTLAQELKEFKTILAETNLFRAPSTQDMEILIQTCLMPPAIKTQSDSLKFVHELKQEMHADLKYVESLKKEIDELESDKAEFSDMYDEILQDCVSKGVMCSYLQSLSNFDALAELQCMYLHKVKERDCPAQKLSKQTEFVSKNDTVYNEKDSNVFRKEREQYFEIQDLKAKLQDKNIAISELKKLIEKGKGKSVDTKFDRPSVARLPNAQRILKPSVLGKPTPFLDSLERKYFPKTKSVPKAIVSEGLSKPVTA
uniref:CCHC-type domain-containing protein n=1 Tax=Tanacetum cinerariifolium TaxID=118510 RepID=A0A6L2LJU5_TANCI|nr:hypothetical protein [Tanacetum cinerariifolium]